MKIKLENLGVLKVATFSPGELTIICGSNNTGKTYATYALFGFLAFWKRRTLKSVSQDVVNQLLSKGAVEIDITEYINKAPSIIKKYCEAYSKELFKIFASPENYFKDSKFDLSFDKGEIVPLSKFDLTLGTPQKKIFNIKKNEGSNKVLASLLVDIKNVTIPDSIIVTALSDALKTIIFSTLLPHPFIASAERTGAAIFRKELNFARNRLIEEMGENGNKELDPFELLSKAYKGYPLPIRESVDFTRRLEEISREQSFISKSHSDILRDFSDILGGSYGVAKNDELFYKPSKSRARLAMDASSSSVRSLLDLGFYLKHVCKPEDLLMIDEPELNLHPENQRRLARLISRLVNVGIKVFITTHSDYMLKEFNTLIMLNSNEERIRKIKEKEGYKDSELLSCEKVKAYIAEESLVKLEGCSRRCKCHTLNPAKITPDLGMEMSSFDKTIDDMNRIQDEIIWG